MTLFRTVTTRRAAAMWGRAGVALGAMALALSITTADAEPQAVASKGITVGQAWARATPGGAKIGAAYLTISAAKGTADSLVSARSSVAARVELHTHLMEGDVMKMRRVDAIEIPDGQTVLLQPSGFHAMLIDLAHPLKAGETVKLTLTFAKAGEIVVDAPVEPLGAKGPHGLDFQPGMDGRKVGGASGDMHHHQH